MRVSLSAVLALPFLIGASLFSQTSGQNGSAGTNTPAVITADGGTSGRMESIFIPPLADAPFSLTLATEWSRPLGNGGSYTLVNQRHIVRDGKGRIYEERWLLVPKGGAVESKMDYIQIADPSHHTLLNCSVFSKRCELRPFNLTPSMIYKPSLGITGSLPDNKGFRQHEELGVSSTNGMNTTGYRDTTTINPGVLGNDKPMVTMREFWYSAQLGVNLISTVDSPQSGKQHFTVTELTTSEPDPKFFEVPEGYSVVDERKAP
jgi:hypothetical protein